MALDRVAKHRVAKHCMAQDAMAKHCEEQSWHNGVAQHGTSQRDADHMRRREEGQSPEMSQNRHCHHRRWSEHGTEPTVKHRRVEQRGVTQNGETAWRKTTEGCKAFRPELTGPSKRPSKGDFHAKLHQHWTQNIEVSLLHLFWGWLGWSDFNS